MPESLTYAMIFNILFFGILGLAILGGLMKGFKKSLFTFVTMFIFYLVFFLTIETVSGALWSMEIPQLGQALGFIDSSLSSYTSFEEAFNPMILALLNFDLSGTSPALSEFVLGMGMFVVKIAYTILYFTVGLVVYKIICFIIKLIFIHSTKGASKNRLLGAVFGFANGAMAIAVMLIMLGGLMSVVENVSTLLPEDFDMTTLGNETPSRDDLYEASYSLIPQVNELADPIDPATELTEMVTAYNENLIVNIASSITITDSYGNPTPFNLYLFDSVASFTYKEEQVSIRQELVVMSNIIDAVFTALDEAGITMDELSGADMGLIISAAASLDLTMLLDSKLLTNALVYILSGDAELEGLEMLIIPDDVVWFDVLDAEGEIETPGELRNILLALNAMVDAAGMVDFTEINLDIISALTDGTIDVLFNSQVLVATVSNLILTTDFGETDIILPDTVFDENNYILKTELKALASAVKLVVSEVASETEFDFAAALALSESQIDTLFESQILSATIGKYIYEMNTGALVIPASVTESVVAGVNTYQVVTVEEMKAVVISVGILFNDFDTMNFDATLLDGLESTLTPGTLDDDLLNDLFASGIIHATLSKMLLDLTSGIDPVISIPHYDVDANPIRTTVGTVEYISATELKNTLKAIYAMGILDFANLDTLDPNVLFDNIDLILESATLHGTISSTLADLGAGVLEIPTVDVNNDPVWVTVGSGLTETDYIIKTEITGILDGLKVLGITNIETFNGTIDLSSVAGSAAQDQLLSSASLHYTISKTLLDLGDSVLIIPVYTEDGVAPANLVQVTVATYTYLSKTELKALMSAFDLMGFTNLESFGASLDSSLFFDNATTLLASASIQATLSDKMLNGTGGNLLVPNTERVVVGSTNYVASTEILAILNSLELLGLTDFAALSFNPANIFTLSDYDELFESTSMQATISKPILDAAEDEFVASGTTSLIVPTALRETVAVGLTTPEQIDLVELKALLSSLEVLGITNFASGNFDASTITTKSEIELTVMLNSGSVHVTIDNMLKANANINTAIPELAQTDALFGINNLTLAEEIVHFILAAGAGGTEFTSVDFDLNVVAGLDSTERDIVLDSMIVRNLITPELETAVFIFNPMYVIPNSYYMESNNTLFFTEAGINALLSYIGM